ncbi:STAS domain-containing protein [Aquipuribacter nitratireducens]|uniref:STAS domain-containing protein n=1 Tax=Aquipuribacter nitratireducens TaxID=650104 RepID=A0ABW0GMX1_9MICO
MSTAGGGRGVPGRGPGAADDLPAVVRPAGSGERADPDVVEAGPAVVEVGPRLLASEAPRLRNALRRAGAEHDLVELRVGEVVTFDTAGLGLLLGLHRLARADGAAMVVVAPPPRLLAALRRKGLHRVLVLEVPLPD